MSFKFTSAPYLNKISIDPLFEYFVAMCIPDDPNSVIEVLILNPKSIHDLISFPSSDKIPFKN